MTTRRLILAGIAAGAFSAITPPAHAQTAPRIRRNINQLPNNHELVGKYAQAVAALKAKPASDPHNWNRLADIHRFRCPHGNWFFLPWHRAYLHHFERICAQAINDANFALPYWDWTQRTTLPAPFLDSASPLHHARDRDSIASTSAVSAANIDRILRTRDFQAFASSAADEQMQRTGSGALEIGPHNTVHSDLGVFGADMGNPALAARDPIFWLHHNNIDRLWDSWIEGGKANATEGRFRNYAFRAAAGDFAQGDFVDASGARVGPRVSACLSSATLGYRFDELRTAQAVVAGIVLPEALRNARISLNGTNIQAGDTGVGFAASARFSVGQSAAALRVGDTASLRELGSVFRREASELLERPVANTAFVGRAIATFELAEPLPRGVTAELLVNCDDPDSYEGQERRIFAGTIASFEHTESGAGHEGHGEADTGGRSFRVDITEALATASGLGSSRISDVTLHIVAPGTGLNLAFQQPQIEFVE